MGEPKVYEAIREVLVEELKIDGAAVTREANLQRDLGLDSLDIATVALALEERLGIDIPDEALHEVETVGQAVTLLSAPHPPKS